MRPAINVGNSVSRVGVRPNKGDEAGRGHVVTDLASTEFAASLSLIDLTSNSGPAQSRARLTEILKQPQYSPIPVEQQVFIWTATKGLADDIAVRIRI